MTDRWWYSASPVSYFINCEEGAISSFSSLLGRLFLQCRHAKGNRKQALWQAAWEGMLRERKGLGIRTAEARPGGDIPRRVFGKCDQPDSPQPLLWLSSPKRPMHMTEGTILLWRGERFHRVLPDKCHWKDECGFLLSTGRPWTLLLAGAPSHLWVPGATKSTLHCGEGDWILFLAWMLSTCRIWLALSVMEPQLSFL